MKKIFISHSWKDKEIAKKLTGELKKRGCDVWIDDEQINPGEVIPEKISAALKQCDTFLLLWSKFAAESKVVSLEWGSAVSKDKKFITCRLDQTDLPELLHGLVYIDFYDFDKGITLLCNNLQIETSEQLEMPVAKPHPVELLPGEWAVEAAMNQSFLDKIRFLHDFISQRSENDGAEVVITLYSRSFPMQKGLRTFEYDLLYYRNVVDDSPMFGPIVADDDRIKFSQDTTTAKRIISEIIPEKRKRGGFVEREGISSAAMFKLGKEIWKDFSNNLNSYKVEVDDVTALLFINGRHRSLAARPFAVKEFWNVLQKIETEIGIIKEKRLLKFNGRRGLIGLLDNPLPGYLEKPEIISADIEAFFATIASEFERISEQKNIAFTVYGYDKKGEGKLIWLWSNGPTSTPAAISLSRHEVATAPLLLTNVVKDSNHKPILIHNLQGHEVYQSQAIRTWLKDASQSNLIVPILSHSAKHETKGANELLGIIDIQGVTAAQFDTDDVQLMYQLSTHYIAGFLLKIFGQRVREKVLSLLPLHNVNAYQPFPRQRLNCNVRTLLELNFNPMKFLLHWGKVRELITTGVTKQPSLVEVWPSMVCNHRCAWCRTEDDRRLQKSHQMMSKEELLGIARDLKIYDNIDVLISGGGEPLLHPHIASFMKEIRGIKGMLGIFTNGTRPRDFRFWEYFFDRHMESSFVRISFNGHTPQSYFQVHFGQDLPQAYNARYAEARKVVMDLLGLRSPLCSIALGDTIQESELLSLLDKANHARRLGVDFIQMRPELLESSRNPQVGELVCRKIIEVERRFEDQDDFAVVYTDGERSFLNHDEGTCYAMNLVPVLVPDKEEGWIRILPCSYTINRWGTVPDLGRMRVGTKLSEFWEAMNKKINGEAADENANIEVAIKKPIAPNDGCPQCRYFRLNKRIQALRDRINHIDLIDQFVDNMKQDPDQLDAGLVDKITKYWDTAVIDIFQAQKIFRIQKHLNIRPSF